MPVCTVLWLFAQSAAGPVRITGAFGPFAALVNGEYEPVAGELHNERPLFRKLGDSQRWLVYASDERWSVQGTEAKAKNTTGGYAYGDEYGLALPQEMMAWRIGDGEAAVPAADLRLTVLTAQVASANLSSCTYHFYRYERYFETDRHLHTKHRADRDRDRDTERDRGLFWRCA